MERARMPPLSADSARQTILTAARGVTDLRSLAGADDQRNGADGDRSRRRRRAVGGRDGSGAAVSVRNAQRSTLNAQRSSSVVFGIEDEHRTSETDPFSS